MTEEQQRQLDFLRSCAEYFDRVADEQESALARLQNKVEEARAELEAMEDALDAAQGALNQANVDAEEAQQAVTDFLEELDSGGPENDENTAAGTGVGAPDATIRTEEN